MSGGSFNYLHTKDADAWVRQQCSTEAESMTDALIAAGAEDAARETQVILAIANGARVCLEALIAHIAPVWRAMEWWKSGDTDQHEFEKALAEYRKEARR
jgi:hypothetical protein